MHARQEFHVDAGIDVLELVLTNGLMPTPPMPGWKLPLAVGTRSPILSVAFTPSTERTCRSLQHFGPRVAHRRLQQGAGKGMEKSELASAQGWTAGWRYQ